MPNDNSPPPSNERYSRQVRYAPLGEAGQRRLLESSVLVAGCGALGSAIANTLVRAGVGRVKIVDRDFLELSNLQRQILYTEADVAAGLPKAIAAGNHLRAINSQVEVEAVVADLTHKNIEILAGDADLVVDGTDNFEVRFLINDFALAAGKPWVYGGVIGAEGQTMTIVPGETACLACLVPEPPPPGTSPTCDTAGILGPVVQLVAAIQATEALKLLSGNASEVSRQLTVIDLWSNHLRQVSLDKLYAAGTCRACAKHDYPWLEGRRGSKAALLCGRNAVQLRPDTPQSLDLAALAASLESTDRVTHIMQNDYLLRIETGDYTLTLFPDGRSIIAGTDDETTARSLFAQLIGN